MSQIRPKVILTNGRVQQPVRVQNQDVVVDPIQSFLISDTAVASLTLSIKNILGFAIDQILLLGDVGGQGTEIVKMSHTVAPTGSTLTLYSSTSATSITIGTGTQTFTTASGLSWLPGDRVHIVSTADSANFMEGTVVSYSTTTLVVLVNVVGGSGTHTDWTIKQITRLPHSASTFVSVIPFDQIEFSLASTIGGSKSVLATSVMSVDQFYTEFNDTTNTTGFYFTRFKTSVGGTFSPYSDAAPYEGYGLLSARAVIDSALGEINKRTSEVLSDVFAFTQLDNCQTECLRELKRWSFMQKFNVIIGSVATGSWKVPVPTNLDDQNTNGSIYNLRLGGNSRLVWVDKEKFDELINDMVFSTLAAPLLNGNTTMTLLSSSDFNSSQLSNTGTVQIGANTYPFIANDVTTGILTLQDAVTVDNTAPLGADVFGSIQTGQPSYWTIFGGYIYYFPVTAATYDNKNLYLDYYIKQVRITSDYDNLIIPDPMVAVNYLCWKFLKKLNNGDETPSSQAYFQSYVIRREKMKQKETLNRTFKFKARYQNFAIQSEFDENDSRIIRDGAFPNTGF